MPARFLLRGNFILARTLCNKICIKRVDHLFHKSARALSKSLYMVCLQLRFFYHMYGSHARPLRLQVREVLPECTLCSSVLELYLPPARGFHCEPSCTRRHDISWTGGHRPVDAWRRASVPLPHISNP